MRNNRDALRGFFAKSAAPLELLCRTDQVGPLPAGWPAAGGLEDPDTGLVRFGWRP